MNKIPIEQPPTYMPPPQHYLPPQQIQQQPVHGQNEKMAGRKFKAAFFATVAFFVFSNPTTYRIMNQVFLAFTGKTNEIVTEAGFPSSKGMFLHAFIFFIVTLILFQKL